MGPPAFFGGNMAELDEVAERLTRMARTIGRVVGIDVEVVKHGNRLIFVDVDGEPVSNDGDEVIATTLEEITAGKFLDDFAARAFRAGMVLRYQQIERDRTP
jgi:Cu/Ag efflux pump CusA